MKASDIFVQSLIAQWVNTIYWVPGEENLDLLESIRSCNKIKLILTRNEQTAVFMASTYWRLTWSIGVALATLWPGATNMVTWVSYAQLGWFPILVITGQKPIKKSKQWFFQIIDVVSMMKPITKYSTSIVSANKITHIIQNACRIAIEERPWAVHIELPEDIASEDVSVSDQFFTVPNKIRRPVIDDKAFDILQDELQKSKKPIILIWAWANRKRITKYLTKFITKYNIPFFNSQMWKWVVDESLPQYIWTAATTSGDGIHDIIAMSDMILSVWYDSIEKPTHLIWQNWTKTIHINFYQAELDEVYQPYMQIVWDIANVFWKLSEKVVDYKWDFDLIYKNRDKYFEEIIKNIKNEDFGENIVWPRQLVDTVRSIIDPFGILSLDNGLYKLRFARNYKTYHPNTLLLDNALATMGAWLSWWMEAKRLYPELDVVVITWDGGLLMNLGDLETAVRLDLDIVVIVLNNNSYWMIERKQVGSKMPNRWLNFWNPDFIKLAESFGWIWYKVNQKKDLSEIIKNAKNQKWLKIIDVPFTYPQKIS